MTPRHLEGLSIIPMGGFEEIGKNSLVFQFEDEMFLWDAGMGFPTDEMPGIDLLVPDYSYVYERADQLTGIFLTHGHEDHIGALPYFLKHFPTPLKIFGTSLTIAFARSKCAEHKLPVTHEWIVVEPRDTIEFGNYFKVTPIQVTHSIPDAVSAAIETPIGTVIHTADFKLDATPLDGRISDLQTFARVGSAGVLLFICDTTNIYSQGICGSERTIGVRFKDLIEKAPGRVIVTSFASHIHRLQQAIDAAHSHGRKVAVVGRSMVKNVQICADLGFLHLPPGCLIDIDKLDRFDDGELLILCTGSQGEPRAALTRIATGTHPNLEINGTDMVIYSAMPIPGNEASIGRALNAIFTRGANVFYGPNAGVHVSGHAYRGEIKLLMNIVQAEFVMPYHGERRHFREFQELSRKMGWARGKIVTGGIGDIMNINHHGEVSYHENKGAGVILIDGVQGLEFDSKLLDERRAMAENGVVCVSLLLDKETYAIRELRIESRGFLLEDKADTFFAQAEAALRESLATLEEADRKDLKKIRLRIQRKLDRFFAKKLERHPTILPVIHMVEG